MTLVIGQLLADNPKPVSVEVDDPVLHAVQAMNAHSVGSVLVRNDLGQLVGIFTERDVLTRVIEERCNSHDTPVGEVMTATPVTADHQTPLEEAVLLLEMHQVSHLPVVVDDEVVGVVALRDLRAAMALALTYENRALRGYIHGPVARRSESFF